MAKGDRKIERSVYSAIVEIHRTAHWITDNGGYNTSDTRETERIEELSFTVNGKSMDEIVSKIHALVDANSPENGIAPSLNTVNTMRGS